MQYYSRFSNRYQLSCHSQRNKRLRWQMGRQLLVAPQSQRGFYPLIYHPHELCPSFSTFGVSDFFQIFPDSGFDLGFRVQSSRETSNFFHGTFYILVWCLWSLRGNSSHKITSRGMPIFQVSTCWSMDRITWWCFIYFKTPDTCLDFHGKNSVFSEDSRTPPINKRYACLWT